MSICPLCNGLRTLNFSCENCKASLDDQGKVTDYLDEYSAYEEINTLKQVDGVKQSTENEQCVHIFSCSQCGNNELIVINE